jgi:hypothetical protein
VAAHADVLTFRQNTIEDGVYKWSNANNWLDSGSQTGVPMTDDRAVIPSNCICTIYDPNAVADTISVGGILDIQAGQTLTLDNDYDNLGGGAGTDNSSVTGTVNLKGSGSALGFIDNNHQISGGGKIVGWHNDAEIREYSSQPTLTIASGLTVRGALKVKMTSLVNNGTVLADDGTTSGSRDTLELYSGTPSGSGQWQAVRLYGTHPAVLRFSVSATALTGGFTVGANSTLDVDADVTSDGTNGHSTINGKIDVAGGVTLDLR